MGPHFASNAICWKSLPSCVRGWYWKFSAAYCSAIERNANNDRCFWLWLLRWLHKFEEQTYRRRHLFVDKTFRVKLDVICLLIPWSNCANILCCDIALCFTFRAKWFRRFALTLAFGMWLSPSSCDWIANMLKCVLYPYQMNERLEVIKKEHSLWYLSEFFF